ncbi:hypothetical protein BT63DRAFT_411659 [Microthyrium microscopicum]|uniref:Uncharacterized protein n=1 Tax=Microthyrium microscopicum TaxID=703497 RepID=A0A6A6UJD3_9PEZI|nr:hypothetical protein BT63DRAFT_411659 [Microthyrium microscopicum]
MVSSLLLSALCAVVAAEDTWGPAVSFGPSKSTIIRAITTVQPGKAPAQPHAGTIIEPRCTTNTTKHGEKKRTRPNAGFLTIWPGMSNGTGNLIQTTLESHEEGKPRCGEKTGEWCVMASVFGDFPGLRTKQIDAKSQGVVKGTDKITIEYRLEKDDMTWTQTVTNTATKAVLSKLSTRSEPYMRGYGTGVECQHDCQGTIEPNYYTDTVITFKSPEPKFELHASGGLTNRTALYTTPVSEQGGRVWKVAKITIPAMYDKPICGGTA